MPGPRVGDHVLEAARRPPAEPLARAARREAAADRLEQEELGFFAAIAAAYDALAASEPERFTVLDASAPPRTVLVAATAAVAPLLQ